MCEFCNYYSSSIGTAGKNIKINKCANETDLTVCNVMSNYKDVPLLILYSGVLARGFIYINYCPMCGRKLKGD